MGCGQSSKTKDDSKGGSGEPKDAKSDLPGAKPEQPTPEEDEEERKKMQAMQGKKKRQGVAAESVDKKAAESYVKPVYEKDEAANAAIRKTLKGNDKMQVLLGHLNESQTMDIVNAFFTREVKQGDEIIRQGDEGDCLYIVAEGAVDVYVARPGEDGNLKMGPDGKPERGIKVTSLPKGALFGELALMYTAPRAATVVMSEAGKVWALDQEPFKMLLCQSGEATYAMYEGWLSEVDIFKKLNHHELAQLSEIMESTLYEENEVIIKQNEPGDKFFVLEDGSAAAYISGSDGEKQVKTYEKKGDYFGEIALLTSEPRKATVKATGSGATVLSISKEDFSAVLGPIADVLKKHVDQYPQYASFLTTDA